MKTVAVIGTFDSKGEEFLCLKKAIESQGVHTLMIDIGLRGAAHFVPDIAAAQVAGEAGGNLKQLLQENNPALCMDVMSEGLVLLVQKLIRERKIDGVITMGGGRGTSAVRPCMEMLPVTMPKMIVSTMAGAGSKLLGEIGDAHVVDSVVDFSGLNDILTPVITQAGAAIAAMVRVCGTPVRKRQRVAASMFGITTPCIDACRRILTEAGYNFYPFHANGMGGPTMEKLIRQGFFDAVLDISTTEILQDMIVPGTGCSRRLEAAAEAGIPQIFVPGALDSINIFRDMLPGFEGRRFHRHNAEICLMRATKEEEICAADYVAEKLNRAKGKVEVVIPMGGFSELSREIPDGEADLAFLDTLRAELKKEIPVFVRDEHINEEPFAKYVCERLRALLPVKQEDAAESERGAIDEGI